MIQPAIALVVGLLFAIGLGIAGMTRPDKVLAFLDVTGAWDPSLALVMLGAVAVHLVGFRLVIRRLARPIFGARFELPPPRGVDRRLLAGAALFGVGWGLVGLCPGPALVSIARGSSSILIFVAAMLAGMGLHAALTRPR